jgi:F0F1-type ATP synthase membrane subunit b/b'
MSGIETVKVIVNAEKQAAQIIHDAEATAANIRKKIDSLIQEQRTEMLATAKKEAAALVQQAEEEGRREAEKYEKESAVRTRELIEHASSKKNATVEKLVGMVMQGEK